MNLGIAGSEQVPVEAIPHMEVYRIVADPTEPLIEIPVLSKASFR